MSSDCIQKMIPIPPDARQLIRCAIKVMDHRGDTRGAIVARRALSQLCCPHCGEQIRITRQGSDWVCGACGKSWRFVS